MTFTETGINRFRDFPKSGSNRLAVADHPGLSLRGKDRTQNRCPNEEMNKNKKTNVDIGTLIESLYLTARCEVMHQI